MAARLARIELPDFGMAEAMPELPAELYWDRIARLRDRVAAEGWDR